MMADSGNDSEVNDVNSLERGDLNVEFQYRLIEQLAETKRSSKMLKRE